MVTLTTAGDLKIEALNSPEAVDGQKLSAANDRM